MNVCESFILSHRTSPGLPPQPEPGPKQATLSVPFKDALSHRQELWKRRQGAGAAAHPRRSRGDCVCAFPRWVFAGACWAPGAVLGPQMHQSTKRRRSLSLERSDAAGRTEGEQQT